MQGMFLTIKCKMNNTKGHRLRALYEHHLYAQWISNSSQELNMSTIELAGTFPNPQHVSWAIIMKARGGILPSKCLFIREKQTLMGGPKVCCTYDWVLGCEPGNIHEPKGLIYPMSQFTVPVCPHSQKNISLKLRDSSVFYYLSTIFTATWKGSVQF